VFNPIPYIMTDNVIKPGFESLIFNIRGYNVMIDADLANLYDTSTKVLKQQVKRNLERFPEDFMFQLSKDEKDKLVTNCDRLSSLKHSSVNPLAFTEQGVPMLSSVLRSTRAITINVEIMRSFVKYRVMLNEHDELQSQLKELDKKINTAFKLLLKKIDSLHQYKIPNKPRKKIGFK
jgi:hypothetical protein